MADPVIPELNDEMLYKLNELGAIYPRFFRMEMVRRAYPMLKSLYGAREAKETLADQWNVTVETIEVYLSGDHMKNHRHYEPSVVVREDEG